MANPPELGTYVRSERDAFLPSALTHEGYRMSDLPPSNDQICDSKRVVPASIARAKELGPGTAGPRSAVG